MHSVLPRASKSKLAYIHDRAKSPEGGVDEQKIPRVVYESRRLSGANLGALISVLEVGEALTNDHPIVKHLFAAACGVE